MYPKGVCFKLNWQPISVFDSTGNLKWPKNVISGNL